MSFVWIWEKNDHIIMPPHCLWLISVSDGRRVSVAFWMIHLPCSTSLTHWGQDKMADIFLTTFIFKCIFLNENVWISLKISLKLVPNGPISNIPALVQIMAWLLLGDKPLSEPMMFSLLTHICVTRPQWVNFMSIYIYKYGWRVEWHRWDIFI